MNVAGAYPAAGSLAGPGGGPGLKGTTSFRLFGLMFLSGCAMSRARMVFLLEARAYYGLETGFLFKSIFPFSSPFLNPFLYKQKYIVMFRSSAGKRN